MLSSVLLTYYCWGIPYRDTTRSVCMQDWFTLAQHHGNPVILLLDPARPVTRSGNCCTAFHCTPGRGDLACSLCFIISQRTHLDFVNSIKYLARRCCKKLDTDMHQQVKLRCLEGLWPSPQHLLCLIFDRGNEGDIILAMPLFSVFT